MTQRSSHDVIVVGAGVIGVSIAIALQKIGRSVLLIDRNKPGASASRGNAGAFAFADIVPLATPGIIRAAPKWLLDPLGPLSVPPSYAFSIAPWLLKFWRASWKDNFPRLMQAQAALMELSRSALERQALDINGEYLLRREGQLRLFHGEQCYRKSLPYWDACRAQGIKFDLLHSAEEIAEIQPGLSSEFTHAGFTPDWINTRDPKLWFEQLLEVFLSRGGVFESVSAESLDTKTGKVLLNSDKGTFLADHLVVAAGAWSRELALTLGDRIPLETERGYNTTFEHSDFDIKTHLTFADHGFVVTRIQDGLRIGGAVELGGLKKPPNFKRAKDMLHKAKQFIPGLTQSTGKEWMGFRPSMPDSLPVIGCSSRTDKVIYAFGHGHLGLTQAAGTAELVRSLVLGEEWSFDKAHFSAQRF